MRTLVKLGVACILLAGCDGSGDKTATGTFNNGQEVATPDKPSPSRPQPLPDTLPDTEFKFSEELPKQKLTRWVDGMIGTGFTPKSDTGSEEDMLGGFVNPVANVPYGMVRFAPETHRFPERWNPRGYHYPSDQITAFGVKNLNGVGCETPRVGAFLPYTETKSLESFGSDFMAAFKSLYNRSETLLRETERSVPGLYEVTLDSGIKVELTATDRTGLARFTFPAGKPINILMRSGETLTIINKREFSGTTEGGNFCENRQSYQTHIHVTFDQDFETDQKTFTFKPDANKDTVINMKVGLSFVSEANAKANLDAEAKDLTFDQAYQRADELWNDKLNTIRTEGGTDKERTIFYSSLFRTFFAPQVYSDVNGEFPEMGTNKIGKVPAGQIQYSTFSAWDTYRSLISLQALTLPKLTSAQMQSLIRFAEHCGPDGKRGTFPMWTENNTNSDIMPGDGSSILLAQSYAFGAKDFDTKAAREIMLGTAKGQLKTCRGVTTLPAIEDYIAKGYIPQAGGRSEETSASTTLEYVSTDWSIAQFLKALKDPNSQIVDGSLDNDITAMSNRSGNWKNVFNPNWKSVKNQKWPQPQPRYADGTWKNEWGGGSNQNLYFREGDPEQYTYMIHHDMRGLFKHLVKDSAAGPNNEKDLIDRLGVFFKHLNAGMQEPYLYIGNEPSFGHPFLYNWTAQPYKTQALVRRIFDEQFDTTPEGLPGNDDEGALSGWYVWAASGLYPELLAVPGLTLTSPLFDKVEFYRDGKRIIRLNSNNGALPYIQNVKVNGEAHDSTWVDIKPDGFVQIDFTVADTPSCWGSKPSDATLPPSIGPDGKQTPRLEGSCGLN